MQSDTSDRRGRLRFASRLAGGALLVATGAIHLDLYLTGYHSIHVIGILFLVQVVAAFALAAMIISSKSGLGAAAGALFALATLGGYLLSLRFGLFGFREVRTAAGIWAGGLEIVAFAVLASVAGGDLDRATEFVWKGQSAARLAGWVLAGASVVALSLLVAALASVGQTTATSGKTKLTTSEIGNVTVVSNDKGFTTYWFVPDTSTTSRCYGTCASYWPPVTGRATAGPGVTGRIGSIERTGGALQVTYDGHPLYTYVGDAAPGQANGNGIDLNGGVWHEVLVSG